MVPLLLRIAGRAWASERQTRLLQQQIGGSFGSGKLAGDLMSAATSNTNGMLLHLFVVVFIRARVEKMDLGILRKSNSVRIRDLCRQQTPRLERGGSLLDGCMWI